MWLGKAKKWYAELIRLSRPFPRDEFVPIFMSLSRYMYLTTVAARGAWT